MYTQKTKPAGDVYIPPNYKGNALYFEELRSECDPKERQDNCDRCEGGCRCEHERGQSCKDSCESSHQGSVLGSLSSAVSKLFSGDNIILLALLAFFLFSGKEKSEDNTMLLLVLLLLF